jgi:hypothetical protein
VVGPVHHELNALGDGAEFPDNQFVADEIVEVGNVLLKLICTIHVIIVRVVPDDNARILHHVLDETETRNLRIRERRIGVGSVGYLVHWVIFRFSELIYAFLMKIKAGLAAQADSWAVGWSGKK